MTVLWEPKYSIGVEEIDQQHRKLFEIANSIYELLKNNIYIDKYDKILMILDELKDYTNFHFKTEEDYMKKIGYKKYLSHKVMHDDFIAKISDVNLNNIDEKQEQYIIEILDFVTMWIKEHILESDKLIG